MALKDKKQKVFGQIAAAKTLTNDLVNLKNQLSGQLSGLINSFPSINNGNDIILFLTDLLKSLVGQQEFIRVIVETLTKYLDKFEKGLKITLKKVLKEVISCGLSPSIPSYLKSPPTTSGIIIRVDKIDFFDMLKTDPNTPIGGLIYDDIPAFPAPLTDSSDFNTFLYGVIQDGISTNPPVTHIWKNSSGVGILSFTFYQNGSGNIPNNSLVVKTTPAYDNKSIVNLNDDYIDSIKIIDAKKVVNQIIDILFGSISVQQNKTRKQLQAEAEINDIIDRLASADANTEINDDFFTFTNAEVARQEEVADNRRNGIIKVKTSTEFDASMPIQYLTEFTDNYNQTSTLVEQRTLLSNTLNNMSDNLANQTPNNQDKQSIKISFAIDMIKNLIKSLANILISPKIIIVFLINFKILYGPTAEYTDAKDFIKKNRALFTALFKMIEKEIVKILMSYAMKEATKLATQVGLAKQYEKIQNRKDQLLSLIGVGKAKLQNAVDSVKNLI
jgi:hypothetical protein